MKFYSIVTDIEALSEDVSNKVRMPVHEAIELLFAKVTNLQLAGQKLTT